MNELTRRETEILQLIGRGWTLRLIAERLNITYITVRRYCDIISKKLGVNSQVKIALAAHRLGVVNLDDIDFGDVADRSSSVK